MNRSTTTPGSSGPWVWRSLGRRSTARIATGCDQKWTNWWSNWWINSQGWRTTCYSAGLFGGFWIIWILNIHWNSYVLTHIGWFGWFGWCGCCGKFLFGKKKHWRKPRVEGKQLELKILLHPCFFLPSLGDDGQPRPAQKTTIFRYLNNITKSQACLMKIWATGKRASWHRLLSDILHLFKQLWQDMLPFAGHVSSKIGRETCIPTIIIQHHSIFPSQLSSGWWFGTFFIFP